MTSQMTATELKAKILSVLDEVREGASVEITKRGRPVAKLVPVTGPGDLRGRFAGVAASNAEDDQLFTTGTGWTHE